MVEDEDLDINWGMEARPFYGAKITWFLTHNGKVLVWRGDEELIHHGHVVIEDDDAVELSDGSARPSQTFTEWEEAIVIRPRYNKVALGDAVVTAAQFFKLEGRINLVLDRKHADHIIVNLVEAE